MDDTLTIDIESTNEASGGIDNLISKLEALKLKVNENLKAIGRLNSALIQMGANSKLSNLGAIGMSNVSSPTIPQASPTNIDMSSVVDNQKEVQKEFVQTGEEIENTYTKMDKFSKTTPTMNVQNIRQCINELTSLQSLLARIERNHLSIDTSEITSRIAELKNTLGADIEEGSNRGQSALNRLKNTASGLGSTFTKIGGAITTGLIAPFKLAFKTTFSQGKKNITDLGSAVEKLSKKLRMTTLALLGTRGAFTAIRKAVSAYMAYDNELSKSLQNNWAVLGSLIAPILERLISLFGILVSYIAGFVKLLTGVDLVARANAKALQGQASGARSAGKAAKDLADELANLQNFDDLNVADFGNDKDSSSGASLPALTVGKIDTEPLEAFLRFLERQDWYGLGMEIARKFNDGLRLIDFDWLETKARQWGKNMADLFNGLTDGTDWVLVGEKIAGGLNTAMGFVNTFFDRYNFDHLGEGLAKGVNSLVNAVNWEDVGKVLGNKMMAIIDTAYSLVNNLDFTSLGDNLAIGFSAWVDRIDFKKMIGTISTGFQGMFKAITELFNSFNWKGLADTITHMFDDIDLGGVASSLSESIVSIFNNLSTLISEIDWNSLGSTLATELINFFSNVDWIGILTSAITLVGEAIIGITDLLWGFISTLAVDIWNRFIEWLDSTQLGHSILNVFREGWSLLKTLWQQVKPKFESAVNFIGSIIEPLANQIGNVFSTAWNLIKIVWDNAKDYFSAVFDTISYIFSFVKNMFEGNFQGAWDAIKSIVDTWKGYFSGVWDKIKSVFSTVGSFFKNTFSNAWQGVKSIFTGVYDWFDEHVVQPIADAFNTIWEGIKNILNKIIDAFNTLIRGLNKISFDVPDWVPKIGGKKWGFDIKEIAQLEVGTNDIKTEGLYYLHQGEAVVPKKYNPAVNNKTYTENNDKVLSRMDSLIELLNNMEMTNIVNVGNDQLYKQTVQYINRQRDIYGTDVV